MTVADGLGTPEGNGNIADVVGMGDSEGSGDGAGCADTLGEAVARMTIAAMTRPPNKFFIVLPSTQHAENASPIRVDSRLAVRGVGNTGL